MGRLPRRRERRTSVKDVKTTVTLRPCPFCGGSAEAYTAPMGTHGVRCYNCGADVMYYGAEGSESKTRDAWNKRKADQR